MKSGARYGKAIRLFILPVMVVGCVVFCSEAIAQTTSISPAPPGDETVDSAHAPIIGSIAIHGNATTKQDIILRELTLGPGKRVSEEEVEYCTNRIYSLGLFTQVNIRYPPMDTTVLLVEVNERWYIFPQPMVGIVDRDFSHWYYGLALRHDNFRGWNEKLFVGGVLGYNPWFSVAYSNPWIFGTAELFASTSFGMSKVVNKSQIAQGTGPNFDEHHYYASQTVGKRFGLYDNVALSVGYNYVSVTDNRSGRTASPDGIDRFLTIGAGFSHDTRNLREYPTAGQYESVSITRKGVGFGEVDFTSYNLDVRGYKKLFLNTSICGRFGGRVTSGPSIPPYEYAFFGFGERIRGHFQREYEGHNLLIGSVEYRIPIISSFYVHVPAIPVPQFALWRFGIYTAVFFDAGLTWFNKQRPDWEHSPAGYGVGVHFLLPYGYVARVDFARNNLGQNEFIFDVGASF